MKDRATAAGVGPDHDTGRRSRPKIPRDLKAHSGDDSSRWEVSAAVSGDCRTNRKGGGAPSIRLRSGQALVSQVLARQGGDFDFRSSVGHFRSQNPHPPQKAGKGGAPGGRLRAGSPAKSAEGWGNRQSKSKASDRNPTHTKSRFLHSAE